MASITIKHASELFQPLKEAIEGLLGRSLSGQEQISVMALEGHPAPSGSERETAAAHLNLVLEKIGDRALEVPTEEFEAAIDEAMEQIRPWPRDDNPILQTALLGRAEVICTLDRHFYESNVVQFCQERGIKIQTDTELLTKLVTE